MSEKPTYTMSEQELEWAEAVREHRPLYATGGHGPWMTCGCPIAKFLRNTAGKGEGQ